MAVETCPSHVKLMEALTYLLGGKEAYFNTRSESALKWQSFIRTLDMPIEQCIDAEIPEDYVALIQLLFLTPLIGLGNISNEFFQDCQFNQSEILIDWKGYTDWHLSYGKWNKEMTSFIKGFMGLAFREKAENMRVGDIIFKRLKLCYHNLNSNLKESQALVSDAKACVQVPSVEEQPSFAIIFSILSAFPLDELNAFYLKLAAGLGSDMMIEDAVKMPININKFYQTPSQDIAFLLEKIRLHFNLLYYGKGLKAKQKKLLKEFWPYLVRRLENYDVKEYVLRQLNQALSLQFSSRSQFYTLMLRLLP